MTPHHVNSTLILFGHLLLVVTDKNTFWNVPIRDDKSFLLKSLFYTSETAFYNVHKLLMCSRVTKYEYYKSGFCSLLKNFHSRIRLRKLISRNIFYSEFTNNYNAYYTPRHPTCLRSTLTLATVYFPITKTPSTAFEVNVLCL